MSLLTLQELFDVLVNLFTTLRFRALAMQLPYNMPLVYRDHTTLQELFEKISTGLARINAILDNRFCTMTHLAYQNTELREQLLNTTASCKILHDNI